jgi:alpha-L-arabinofuranosidase
VRFESEIRIKSQATQIVLAGDPKAVNTFANPRAIVPQTSDMAANQSFNLAAPPHSLTVVRMKTR